jgi:methionine-rich copper-binding protein CopC
LAASRLFPALLAVPLIAVLSLANVPAARAHAILLHSQPAPSASVSAGEVAFDLHYNSRIDAGRSRLTLIAPDHGQSVMTLLPGSAPDELKAKASLGPGTYTLRWQVLAIDGHITRGDLPFTVTGR